MSLCIRGLPSGASCAPDRSNEYEEYNKNHTQTDGTDRNISRFLNKKRRIDEEKGLRSDQ